MANPIVALGVEQMKRFCLDTISSAMKERSVIHEFIIEHNYFNRSDGRVGAML